MATLLTIDPPTTQVRRQEQGFALFRLGFRPFYLLAAILAAVSVPLWVAMLRGWVGAPPATGAMLWHAHEMVYGFALAVITGFVFTAARTWTGLDTPLGRQLVVRVCLWLAARVLFAVGWLDLAIAVELIFLASVGIPVARVLIKTASRRNYFLLAMLSAFAIADLVFWAALKGWLAIAPASVIHFGVYLVATLIIVIGGRVTPSFTANVLPGLRQWRSKRLDIAALAVSTSAFVSMLVSREGAIAAALCLSAALLQAIRLAGWNGWAARRQPMLWILHASYAWLAIGFLLAAAAAVGWVMPQLSLHALSTGLIGGMIMGMITRTALGHTGRALRAGRAEVAMFVLIQLAAVVRVFPAIVWPGGYLEFVAASAVLWSLAFLLYVAVYAPRLAQPRVDGRAG
ncbi:MAG: hypothetical protein RL341_2284 [Pseudomonadota bacterium]|jgi:uncharacterized protein involved in response to NO